MHGCPHAAVSVAATACRRSNSTGLSIPSVECRRIVLYSSIHAATARRACSLVEKCCRDSSSNSNVELNDSATALSRADPVRPIDCVAPAVRHTCLKTSPVYSLDSTGRRNTGLKQCYLFVEGLGWCLPW